MKKILAAIALTVAVPAMASAADKACCCDKMKADGADCMDKDRPGPDLSKPATKTAPADAHHH